MVIELVIIFIIIFIGSFIQGVSGFGFGLLAMSFLPFMFSIKDSTLLAVSLALVLAASIALQLMKYIKWRALVVLLSAALVGRIGAFFILHNYGEQDILRIPLALFLIAVVIYLFSNTGVGNPEKINRTWLPVLAGFGGGFTGGIFAVGGPFFVFYLMLVFSDNKYAYSANLQITFLVTNAATVILHGVSGDFSNDFMLYFLTGIAAVLIGSRIGVHFFAYMSQEKIKKLAGAVVAVAAVNLILFG